MPDQHYWEVNGIAYDNKFQAIQAADGKMSKVSFKGFSPEFFSDIYWKQEPTQSFEELLKERCQQLRDTYSYIRMMYSGGCDSTTMLNAFLRNGIHIDEINAYRFSLDNNFNNSSNIEINNHVIPYFNKLQKLIPKTKFTVADYGKEYFEPVINEDWFALRSTTALRYFHNYELLDNTSNFCNLYGELTPSLVFNNNKWYALFTDSTFREYLVLKNLEFFYSSSDLPALHAKQTYMLKNFCEKNNILKEKEFEKARIGVIREQPIAPDAPYQVGNKLYYGSQHYLMSIKTKVLLKETTNTTLKRRYIDLLKYSKISNKFIHSFANKSLTYAKIELN
tara:strand:+ start:254 stop:1261 length:1008 start_codon:yes stop_codon:yes gene_type:complete